MKTSFSNALNSNSHWSISMILRLPSVTEYTGLSRSSIYNRISQGLLPKPISLGGRSVGWPLNEIESINKARIAGKSDKEIRELVSEIEAARGN